MKRFTLITSALALILTASTTFAVEGTSWGQLKAALTATEDGTSLLTFSPQAAARASKIAAIPAEGRTVSQLMVPGIKGKLTVDERNGSGKEDNLNITFMVHKDGLTEPVLITMTVYGNYLSELVIVFQPAGLVFLKDAELEIKLGSDLVDMPLEQLQVYHTYADGTVEETELSEIKSMGKDFFYMIHAKVPGFSRYSTGGGW